MNETILKKIARYYFMGLNAKEIGKLLDLNARTVQRYVKDNVHRLPPQQPQTRQQKALAYVAQGFSYSDTAKRFRVSRTTVYKWAKAAKTPTTPNAGQ